MNRDSVKYPDITVKLVGGDGNAFVIMGKVVHALRSAGVPTDEIDKYKNECWDSEDYDALLRTTMAWVNVE